MGLNLYSLSFLKLLRKSLLIAIANFRADKPHPLSPCPEKAMLEFGGDRTGGIAL
jgi:hypothetical protein